MAVLGKNGRSVLCRLPALLGFHRLAKAIALTIHFENVAAVGKPVQKRSGHPLSLEDLAPVAKRQVARDQHAGALVALAKHPEQELDTATTERHVSQLVADQQLGPFQLPQELIQRVLLLSLF